MGRNGCGLGDWNGRKCQIGKTANQAAEREDSHDCNDRLSRRRNHRSQQLWTIVEIDPAHSRDSSHGLRQRYGARKPLARELAFISAATHARDRLRPGAPFLPRSSHRLDSTMPVGQRLGWVRRVSSGQRRASGRLWSLRDGTGASGEPAVAREAVRCPGRPFSFPAR
jgi:hypothetical protein